MHSTKKSLERAAMRLFAERGIGSVSVRDILKAAGQQNGASLHYHFRSKQDLVLALIEDEMRALDERRTRLLDMIEAEGRPVDLRQVVEILVRAAIPASGTHEHHHARFIVAVRAQHPELHTAADSLSYRRIAELVFRLALDRPRRLVRQRLEHMSLFLETALAAREIAIEDGGPGRSLWKSPFVIDNLIDSALGILIHHTDQKPAKSNS